MASNREEAKKAVVAKDKEAPELEATFQDAHRAQLQIAQDSNRHKEAMQGILGRFFGPGQNIGTFAGFTGMVFGFGISVMCLYFAFYGSENSMDQWLRTSERFLAAALAALAYLLGRGQR